MGKALVALDTDHIKEYVFGTDKLREIRGASALLDYLNRIVMREMGEFFKAEPVYANGGSGLFLVDGGKEKAQEFGKKIRQIYREESKGRASITYVVEELPESIKDVWNDDIWGILELLRWRLREAKSSPPNIVTILSHPFMRPCDACGIEYAQKRDLSEDVDEDEREALYCLSCLRKREEDSKVKKLIPLLVEGQRTPYDVYLWDYLITRLRSKNEDLSPDEQYDELSPDTERPHDFNVFRYFKGTKEYLGLIYADANGMGKKIESCRTLEQLKKFADDVDTAIYESVCFAIKKHLKIKDHLKPESNLKNRVFPFDILLIGGDDVLMVTPASVALQVAYTIATKFYELTGKGQPNSEGHTLSVGVVLAPVKYPFGLLLDLVDDTLKAAKKAGSKKVRSDGQQVGTVTYGDTRINFMTVTGNTSQRFGKVYTALQREEVPVSDYPTGVDFCATLRPYNIPQFKMLLEDIHVGGNLKLGRTKLHQLREAILKMNLTTSVVHGLAALRNWDEDQSSHVVRHLYRFGSLFRVKQEDSQGSLGAYPKVTFPWFADDKTDEHTPTYRTSLLDFVDLYDFLSGEES